MHLSAKEKMHLPHARHVQHRKQGLHVNLRASFLVGFAGRALGQGFAQLHEARRQGPKAFAWFDVALAQQHLVAQHGNGAHHIQGVFVMHRVASRANRAQFGVAIVR